jgi:hypothetical protein
MVIELGLCLLDRLDVFVIPNKFYIQSHHYGSNRIHLCALLSCAAVHAVLQPRFEDLRVQRIGTGRALLKKRRVTVVMCSLCG